jgi:predicted NBD/HSP70 family sugar kinase/predicted transcriptional regulator
MASKKTTGNAKLMREINQGLVLELIKQQGPISRTAIAKRLNLALPTVMRIVDQLLNEGLIIAEGLGDSSGGRPPVLFNINPQSRYLIGVDVKRRLTVILADLMGNKLHREEALTESIAEPAGVIEQISEMVKGIIAKTGVDVEKIAGIGIGTPGMNFKSGSLIESSAFYGWHHVDIQGLLKGKFSFPVVVENVAKAGALGELWLGKGMGFSNFIYVFADFGVGSGIVVNGQLYRGMTGDAGEFGHTVVEIVDGRQCYCGNSGCLEMYTSIPAILKEAEEVLGQSGVKFQDLVEEAHSGSDPVIEIFRRAGKYLGIGLANLINLYNPEAIILGGEISLFCPWYVESAREHAKKLIFSKRAQKVQILTTGIHEDAGAMGAVALVMNKIFG